MGPKNKLWSQVSSSQALTWEMWDAETPDIHEKVKVEHQCHYEVSLANFKQENPEGVLQTPEQYEGAINFLVPFLEQVMAVITENTGFTISVLVGGPSPVANGDLVTFHIHKGVTKEEHPLDFGSFAHKLVNDSLIPKFIEFLGKAFLDDVCASHSLSKAATPDTPTPTTSNMPDSMAVLVNVAHKSQLNAKNATLVNTNDNEDHNSQDEHTVFGSPTYDNLLSPGTTPLIPNNAHHWDAEAAPDTLNPDHLLLLSTMGSLLLAMTNVLSSGTMVLLSPEAPSVLQQSPPTSWMDQEIIKAVPHCSLHNAVQYGGKRKMQTSETSAMSPP
ncbi:hypothetical protein BS47DRAFT_1400654 [Hydnum rufescens UP504]|uniref:Uncharacterized protein n=1 Tax=Hydnum rufescens UP504 TaxID=1448309 RepID=A0A9P6AG67_9AGAM|nr:hypothetical protein BS47DRAFT_1400654 [Hydnum rufescens UP504]